MEETCGAVQGPWQDISFVLPFPPGYEYDLDEMCTVTSVSPTYIAFDCNTYQPYIELDLVDPWVPTLSIDETVRVVAHGFEFDDYPFMVDFRIERADNTLALAGVDGLSDFDSVGLGAVPVSWVLDACTPGCNGDNGDNPNVVWQQIGLTFEDQGEQLTLFTGMHETVGGLEIWVPRARRVACHNGNEPVFSYNDVFISFN